MSKTTKEDFGKFKMFALDWQRRLGLTSWSLYFDRKKEDMRDTYACCYWDMGSQLATIVLTTDWDDLRPKNDGELERVALHEVLHVGLAELVSQAEARYTTQAAIDMAEHSIIRRLENSLMEAKNARVR